MDMGNKDAIEQEKRDEESLNYPLSNVSSDWQISGASLANSSIGLVSSGNQMAVGKGDLMDSSSCSSASMVDSLSANIWDHALGFCDINVQNNASSSNMIDNRTSGFDPVRAGVERALGMGWTPSNTMLKGGTFLPNGPGMLPHSLPQFPADSGFIERAARFSCFSGGNFGDMMPFSLPGSVNPYSRGIASMQGQQEIFGGNGLRTTSSMQSQRNEMNMGEVSGNASLPVGRGGNGESLLKNDKKSDSLVRSHDEAKQCAEASGNESDEAEFGGRRDQQEFEGTGPESPGKGFSLKKRKRSGQDNELDLKRSGSQSALETSKEHTDSPLKGDQVPNPTVSKPSSKHNKQGSQASDSPNKEEYIHVRARRGQATNSHSLAERVRREKISERMKFLQDLVPGCSKVTGKAVMLDEIINYVQSLQRQVEFLSMKLATVNPRLDFNIESLLAKDIFQSRAGPSSSVAFPHDMTLPYPSLQPPQPGLIQTSLPGLGSSSDALRRSINPQLATLSGGFKEPTSQVPSVWNDELHNVVQMGFNTSAPLSSEDLSGSLPPGHMKAEL